MGQSLFLIVYAAGHIGGVAGPLPYGMAECEVRRDEFRQAQQATLSTGLDAEGKPIPAKNVAQIKSMSFECEWRDYRPKLGEKAGI